MLFQMNCVCVEVSFIPLDLAGAVSMDDNLACVCVCVCLPVS